MAEKIKNALQSPYVVPCVFLFAFLFWLAEFTLACISLLALFVAAILLFCDDPKNIFCPVIYAGFFVKDIVVESNWAVYAVCIGIAAASFIVFAVRHIIKRVKSGKGVRLGKLFFPLVVLDVAFMLGGIIGNFNVGAFFATAGFCAVMLLLYFIAVNFTENLGEYLAFLFVCGAAYIIVQRSCYNLKEFGEIKEIFKTEWTAAEPPNTAAVFVALGAAASLALGVNRKHGYLMLIPFSVFTFYLITLCCRGVIISATITLTPLFVYSYVKSREKKGFIITLLSVLAVFVVLELTTHAGREAVKKVIEKIKQAGSSGRTGENGLWAWCIAKFKEYPIFGYGFISKDGPVPGIRPGVEYYIHAHNTVLQWAVSCGVFGLLCSVWFYFEKYKLIFLGFKENAYLSCFAIIVAMSGMVDQAAAMDPFVFLLPLVILAATENLKKIKEAKPVKAAAAAAA